MGCEMDARYENKPKKERSDWTAVIIARSVSLENSTEVMPGEAVAYYLMNSGMEGSSRPSIRRGDFENDYRTSRLREVEHSSERWYRDERGGQERRTDRVHQSGLSCRANFRTSAGSGGVSLVQAGDGGCWKYRRCI
jgi:hypothetical protein